MTVLLVAIGGAMGALARFGIAQATSSIWAILAINVAGSFALGVLIASAHRISGDVNDAVGIGFLGGFTTFSTFSMHVVQEADAGRAEVAFLYAAASVVLGVVAAGAGFYGTRALS